MVPPRMFYFSFFSLLYLLSTPNKLKGLLFQKAWSQRPIGDSNYQLHWEFTQTKRKNFSCNSTEIRFFILYTNCRGGKYQFSKKINEETFFLPFLLTSNLEFSVLGTFLLLLKTGDCDSWGLAIMFYDFSASFAFILF